MGSAFLKRAPEQKDAPGTAVLLSKKIYRNNIDSKRFEIKTTRTENELFPVFLKDDSRDVFHTVTSRFRNMPKTRVFRFLRGIPG
ncbi:MAG: hypothetical protein IKC53_10510 [Lentisphaeria bacterium]|nr:hypothetical protein [Lentisphaeria bacterium]